MSIRKEKELLFSRLMTVERDIERLEDEGVVE